MAISAKVFVSGTSGDLGTFRRAVSETLVTLGVLPVVQEHFPPDTGSVIDLLREKISHCDAMICLVGDRYGVEPKAPLSGTLRRSYSQIEHDIAVELGKPVFLFLSSPNCEVDPSSTESAELQELQRGFRERLRAGDRLWTQFRSRDDLVAKVMLLRFDPESIAASLNSRLSVLLFTDLVDSTGLKSRMGDDEYARQIAIPHNQLFREILKKFRDAHEENYTGDGFLATFERVQDAVNAALLFHDALDQFAWEGGVKPTTRIGIHLGQVTRVPGADLRRPHIASHSADLCARLMSLGRGGQTLLTRAAFDNARQYLRAAPVWSAAGSGLYNASITDSALLDAARELRWLSHGRYQFQGRDEPMEVFEVGVVGRAPLKAPPDTEKVRRADSLEEQQMLGWQPGVGQEIPDRKGWRIERKLGEGGFGEVWLARNSTTRRLRVFKFCMDPLRLQTFRRELTLFLLMKEALGDLQNIVPLHEVRLEKRPYYLESEYVSGGNLRHWVDRRGGFVKIPLEERLKLIQQIAQAVAVAHSVGIIHRDLKPSNVFMSSQGPEAHVVLADFGIGALIDSSLLERYGISLQGFTDRTLLQPGAHRSGSRMYQPPEDIVGRPPTMQGDVYALGVLLFQMLTGDFDRPLGPGWERVLKVSASLDHDCTPEEVVMRELLMEDVAVSVDSDVQHRLIDAHQFAARLATLPQRVELALVQRRQAKSRARFKALRRQLATASGLVAVVAGLAIFSTVQWRRAERYSAAAKEHAHAADMARADAEVQAARAVALAADAEAARQQAELHARQADEHHHLVLDTLHRLVFDLHEQLSDQPGAQEIQQAVLTTAYDGLERTARTAPQENPRRERLAATVQLKAADMLLSLGRTREADSLLEAARAKFSKLQASNPQCLVSRRDVMLTLERLGNTSLSRGDVSGAFRFYLEVLAEAECLAATAEPGSPAEQDLSRACFHLGNVCQHQGDFAVAQQHYRRSHDIRQRLAAGQPRDLVAQRDLSASLRTLGDVAVHDRRTEEALGYYRRSQEILEALTGDDPRSLSIHRDLLVCHHKLALVSQSQSDLPAARQHCELALEIAERLATDSQQLVARSDVAVSLVRLANIAQAQRDADAALANYSRAEQHFDAMQSESGLPPDLADWPDRIAQALAEIRNWPADALFPASRERE